MNSRAIHFKCTSCGICCNSSPVMGLFEAFKLGDVFIPELVFGVRVVPRHDELDDDVLQEWLDSFSDINLTRSEFLPYAEMLRKSFDRTHIKVDTPEDSDYDLWVQPYAKDLMPDIGKCTALRIDGLCDIYERRPSVCKTQPFEDLVSPDWIRRHFEGSKKQLLAAEAKCEFDDLAPIVWENGKFVDEAVAVNQQGEWMEKEFSASSGH